ncbi:MAG: PqqD family peptide modification chaperone [Acidobacteriota bacterium]
MMHNSNSVRPLARKDGIVVQELSDETLVYDLTCDKAHCLNQTAAIIWNHCDGTKEVAELAQILSAQSGLPADEQLVWLALDQLSKAHLLPKAKNQNGLSRREVIKRVGISAAMALPLVTSIVAPSAVQAATCFPSGQPCTSSAECCSGICSSNVCA